MKDSRTEKMISIAVIMDKYNYENNETINRRINNYDFQANTTITHNDNHIKISTETNIKECIMFCFCFPMARQN